MQNKINEAFESRGSLYEAPKGFGVVMWMVEAAFELTDYVVHAFDYLTMYTCT